MAHRYLNKLGIESDNDCIFNTERGRCKKRFKKERKKYGFDTRETWSMDFTSATWLYEHLKVYKKVAGEIVDLTCHKFNIPVLHDIPKDNLDEDISKRRYTIEVMQEHTQDESIDIMIEYLEKFLLKDRSIGDYDFDKFNESERRAYESLQCAFKIYAEVICSMWW